MTVALNLKGTLHTLETVNKFLRTLETITPRYVGDLAIGEGEDNVIFVEAEYLNEDEAFEASEKISIVSTNLLIETGVWIVLATLVNSTDSKTYS
jgi:hypothetical protein